MKPKNKVTTDRCPITKFIKRFIIIHYNIGVVDEWICHRTVDHKVRGSSPTAALMYFGKTLIYICHSPPRC